MRALGLVLVAVGVAALAAAWSGGPARGGASTSATTTVTFSRPGDYLFICHLPGHESYGMVGVLRVLPAAG